MRREGPNEAKHLHYPFRDVEGVISDVPVVNPFGGGLADTRIALLVLPQLSLCRAFFGDIGIGDHEAEAGHGRMADREPPPSLDVLFVIP